MEPNGVKRVQTRLDETGPEGPNGARHGHMRQEGARQGKMGQDGAKQGKMGQDGANWTRVGPDKAGLGQTGPDLISYTSFLITYPICQHYGLKALQLPGKVRGLIFTDL